jgi:hypothetical protein
MRMVWREVVSVMYGVKSDNERRLILSIGGLQDARKQTTNRD